MTQPERVALPSASRFREIVAARRPVIIDAGAALPRACTAWTLDYLRARILPHKSELRVVVTDDGNWVDGTQLTMPTAAFFDALAADAEDRCRYRPQIRLDTHYPELLADVELPAFLCPPLQVSSTNLWLGRGGNWTRTHWDLAENLVTQVHGDKEVALSAPDGGLRPRAPWSAEAYNQATVADLLADDLEAQLGDQRLAIQRCTLRPGDTLYVPSLWWHCMRGRGLNMSVNSWFSPWDRDEMHAWALLRRLAEHFDRLPAFHREHIRRYVGAPVEGPAAPTITLDQLLGLDQIDENAS
ncbi:MAG: cupin-like domain-containing protein [Myxococcales bacterium]|nr:cupin-like domain-containing protein [Myxococcales bacterium]